MLTDMIMVMIRVTSIFH